MLRFWVLLEINLRVCSKTQWQMFLLVSGRHVDAHLDGHQHGVSIKISINLGKTFLRISSIRKIAVTWILGRVFAYLPSYYFQILDLIYWTVLICYFDLFWIAWHWKTAILEKIGNFFSSLNPFPSMPSVATEDRKQLQYIQIVLNNKTWSLVFEFSWCEDTFWLFIKLPNSMAMLLLPLEITSTQKKFLVPDGICTHDPSWSSWTANYWATGNSMVSKWRREGAPGLNTGGSRVQIYLKLGFFRVNATSCILIYIQFNKQLLRLFSNRSQMTSKSGENKKVAHEA